MAVNKVKYGDTTLIDLTNMTAVASDVATGKTFYGKDGVLTNGSATASGLVYETGTYTLTSDEVRPQVNFSNTHATAPVYVAFFDMSGTEDSVDNSGISMVYTDCYKLWGYGYPYSRSSGTYRYATVQYIYRGTSTTSINSGTVHFSYNSDNTKATSGYPRYWVDESGFRPYTNSGSRYWRTGRTYKWIAVWKW